MSYSWIKIEIVQCINRLSWYSIIKEVNGPAMLEMISFRLWSTCKDYLLALILAIRKDTDKFIVHCLCYSNIQFSFCSSS